MSGQKARKLERQHLQLRIAEPLGQLNRHDIAGQNSKYQSWDLLQRLRRIEDPFGRQQAKRPQVFERTVSRKIGESMRQRAVDLRNAVLRHLAVPTVVILLGAGSALAQSGSNPEQAKPAATADTAKDVGQNQSKDDIYALAAQKLNNNPAGNRECVLLGRKVVGLIWRDDPGTAVRQLELYDRFGCPGGHIQAALRCMTGFEKEINANDKVPNNLKMHIDACWINPAAQPEVAAAAATQPATNASPESNSAPAASPSPAPSK